MPESLKPALAKTLITRQNRIDGMTLTEDDVKRNLVFSQPIQGLCLSVRLEKGLGPEIEYVADLVERPLEHFIDHFSSTPGIYITSFKEMVSTIDGMGLGFSMRFPATIDGQPFLDYLKDASKSAMASTESSAFTFTPAARTPSDVHETGATLRQLLPVQGSPSALTR